MIKQYLKSRFAKPNPPISTITPLDNWLNAELSLAKPDRPLTIVQVGASDGLRNDPLRKYLRDFANSSSRSGTLVRAVLVEPLPAAFASLSNLYADSKHVIAINAAISGSDGHVDIFTVSPDCPYEADQLSSFSRAHLRRNGVKSNHICVVKVEAVTLSTLISRNNLDVIDLYQIDTEGYDHAIVKSILELGESQLPRAINFEFNQLPKEQITPLYAGLKDAGYDWTNCDWDSFCTRKK